MRSIVVIGPPDIFELVESVRLYEIEGYLSPQREERSIYHRYTYLGEDSQIPTLIQKGHCFAIALNSNTRRQQLIEQIINSGGEAIIVKHPDATVYGSAELGEGTVVAPRAVVSACARIGQGVVVNYGSLIGHDVEVRDWTFIAPSAILLGYAKVGSNTFIGANSVIYPYVKIGDNVTVSANTTVTKDIQDNVKVMSLFKKRIICNVTL